VDGARHEDEEVEEALVTIRIVMVDDHHMFRECLRSALNAHDDFDVVGEGASADDARALAREHEADVFLMDVELVGIDGIAAVSMVLDLAPQAKVLVLTMHAKDPVAIDALVAGAHGIVAKKQSIAELARALRDVVAGGMPLAPGLSPDVREIAQRRRGAGDSSGPLGPLTEREREIFRLVTLGNQNDAIAAALSISGKTVESHRVHINRKLGAHSPADLVRFAAGHGLLYS
jgi:DNA-binding NarL/FixJ family response regulator